MSGRREPGPRGHGKPDLHEFLHKAENASVVLLFYAGHGMQVDGKNYLVPVDAKLAEASDLPFETIEIDKLLDSLGDPGHTNIILLDACRDNPLARSFASHLPATPIGRSRDRPRRLFRGRNRHADRLCHRSRADRAGWPGQGQSVHHQSAALPSHARPGNPPGADPGARRGRDGDRQSADPVGQFVADGRCDPGDQDLPGQRSAGH